MFVTMEVPGAPGFRLLKGVAMTTHLTLVVDNGDTSAATSSGRAERSKRSHWVHRQWLPRVAVLHRDRLAGRWWAALRRRWRSARAILHQERGAVTAEYAIVILAGVAFAGLLVAIMRSGEIRQMLVDLVQGALYSAG